MEWRGRQQSSPTGGAMQRIPSFPPSFRLGPFQRPRSVSQELANLLIHPSNRETKNNEASNFQEDFSLYQIITPTPQVTRKTKIVCAIGPSSWSKEMLGELLDAGMNVARLNFSHGDHDLHQRSLRNLRRAIMERPGCHCAVLLDTKGPEIRTGILKDHEPIQLRAGQTLVIDTDYSIEGDSSHIACSYPQLPTSVSPGMKILCDDGSLTMTVLQCDETSITVSVLNSHILEEKKNMNLPGASIQIPGITSKDENDLLHFAIPQAVDIVSGSFVRSAANVQAIKDCLGAKGRHIRVHAKIESVEALRNIDGILKVADGVHVSRGDLGMELNPEQVFLAQKMIIRKANLAGIPVVTSTQMLQSMTQSPSPSNAECTDVANAVLDGTDAVMLSAETAKGKYPTEAVQTMHRICVEAERTVDYSELYRATTMAVDKPLSMGESVAAAAAEIALDVRAPLIISFTETGQSTRLLAKYRPEAHILAVTASSSTARQLTGVSRSVNALLVESMVGVESLTIKALAFGKERGWACNGDAVVLTHGLQDAVSGRTNVVKVIEVVAQGFASPTFRFHGLRVPSIYS